MNPRPILSSLPPFRPRGFLAAMLVAALLPSLATRVRATILTFEDFTANNLFISTVPNPFGAGQYGSRAGSAINAGFQQGEGWTPNVLLTWSSGWQTYVGWPFGNDAQTGAGNVAQSDFSESGGLPLDLTLTPDAGFGVRLKSFAFTVWDGSPILPVQIQWTVYAGSPSPANQIASGLSAAIGAAGGAQTIETGLTNVLSSGRALILRLQMISGDPTWIAINNIHLTQAPAKEAPVLTWPQPDAILVGTALSPVQLNAAADVPGTFTYSPPAGTVLAEGTHTLTADFTPSDAARYESGRIATTLLVKIDNVPVISARPPLKIGTNDPLTVAMFNPVSNVRGTFSITPPEGTRLPEGAADITLMFTPENPAFVPASTRIVLTVVPAVPEGTIWTFADPADRLRPLCGDDALTFFDPAGTGWASSLIRFGTASGFGLPLPAGGDPQVMHFSHAGPGQGLKLDFNDAPNGVFADNGWVGNYTLVFDLLLPAASLGTAHPLYNANAVNANPAEASISAASPAALQALGRTYGEIRANTWHRVTLVVRASSAEGQLHLYVDGTFLGAIGSNDTLISAGYALEDFVLLLTDNTGNGGEGYLSGLRFIGRNLDYAEVKALGGVDAGGPHVAGPAAPRPPFQPLRDVLIIGHRGNGGFAPEDTLPAYLSAFAHGADAVEMDIRRTADNRVVAMHDSTVTRTTDGSGPVSQMTLAEVQRLDAGSWFSPAFAGTPPPALRQVMAAVKDAYPNAILYLDCKVNGLAPLIKEDCDATGFPAERLWFWVYEQTSEAAAYRAVFPAAKIIWGENGWAARGNIYEWPRLSRERRSQVAEGMKERGVYGFDFGDNEADTLNPATIQELRAAGFFVSLYSTLHPAAMARAIDQVGIDGMETDFPGVLRELMPLYTVNVAATGLSTSTAEITWGRFPGGGPSREIRLRGKPKAAAAWSTLGTVDPRTRTFVATGLEKDTVYEFQPISYVHGQPQKFGSVAEASTLDGRHNFHTAYTDWQSAHRTVGEPGEDSDADGVVNLVEFALALDPLSSAPPPMPAVSVDAGQLIVRYERRAGAYVRWTYDTSSDLDQWNPLLSLEDYTEAVTSNTPGIEQVRVTVSPAPDATRRFVRIRAEPLP